MSKKPEVPKTSKESDLLAKLNDVLLKQELKPVKFLDPKLPPSDTTVPHYTGGKNMTSLYIFGAFVVLGLLLSAWNFWHVVNKKHADKNRKIVAALILVVFVVLCSICIREYFILAQ